MPRGRYAGGVSLRSMYRLDKSRGGGGDAGRPENSSSERTAFKLSVKMKVHLVQHGDLSAVDWMLATESMMYTTHVVMQ